MICASIQHEPHSVRGQSGVVEDRAVFVSPPGWFPNYRALAVQTRKDRLDGGIGQPATESVDDLPGRQRLVRSPQRCENLRLQAARRPPLPHVSAPLLRRSGRG
jgi:hypothetical protein